MLFESRPTSQWVVSRVSAASSSPLQLSSIPLPSSSSAPGFTIAGSLPQPPGTSQQSPSATVQPSPSQSVVALLQVWHWPPRQESPPVQALAQAPQWLGFVCGFTHCAPHLRKPVGQGVSHTPLTHCCPGAQ